MTFQPIQFYGLRVPVGAEGVLAVADIDSDELMSIRFTMAAIDPSISAPATHETNGDLPPRATLKIRRYQAEDESDDDDDDDDDDLEDLVNGGGSDEDEEDEPDLNGAGPSDPVRSPKKRGVVIDMEDHDDEEMDIDAKGMNGGSSRKSKGKGKAKATDDNLEKSSEGEPYEEFVICTLDTTKNYQQPLDFTVNEGDLVEFFATGAHDIYLTGNVLMHIDEGAYRRGEEGDDEYDMSPDEDELLLDEDDESDELDDLEDPRIKEVDSEEEAPKLIRTEEKKGKNKRPVEESDEEVLNLDNIISKSLKPEPATDGGQKLSKKQMKKLKNNAGDAIAPGPAVPAAKKEAEVPAPAVKESPASSAKADKKVQFAKNLERGPVDTPKPQTSSEASKGEKQKSGVKVIQGVKIDDRKQGTGPAAKKGDKVGMRYIGKLEDGKQFDANKKGKPFSFKIGTGEVIKGWDVGIVGMSAGGERRLTIPANMAYGPKGMPGIPPNSTLVFDVKLLSVN